MKMLSIKGSEDSELFFICEGVFYI